MYILLCNILIHFIDIEVFVVCKLENDDVKGGFIMETNQKMKCVSGKNG